MAVTVAGAGAVVVPGVEGISVEGTGVVDPAGAGVEVSVGGTNTVGVTVGVNVCAYGGLVTMPSKESRPGLSTI